MRIFCDTNIITEFLEKRLQYEAVAKILALSQENNTLFVSEGGFYTITFLVDKQLRRMQVFNPERLEKERKILLRILFTFHIANVSREGLMKGVTDENFKDLEDSYQLQAALNSKAEYLLTINIKDFKDANPENIHIMTPQEFVDSILEEPQAED